MGLQSTLEKISTDPNKQSEIFNFHNYWNIHNFLISNVDFINDQIKEFEVSRYDLKELLYYLECYTTPCRKEEFIHLDEEINLIEKLLLSTKDKNFTFYYSYCN